MSFEFSQKTKDLQSQRSWRYSSSPQRKLWVMMAEKGKARVAGDIIR